MSSVIVLSQNAPHQAPGKPGKISPSAPANLAATRQIDTICLMARIVTATPMYPRNARKYIMPPITKDAIIAT